VVFNSNTEQATEGADSVDGGAGWDKIVAPDDFAILQYASITGVEEIDGNGHTGVVIWLAEGHPSMDLSAVTLNDVAEIDGTFAADTIIGSAGNDAVWGGAGDDSLAGGLGDDHFLFDGTTGSDAISGGSGFDTIEARQANEVIGLSSVSGVELITSGGYANVSVAGSNNADVLDFTNVTLSGIASVNGQAGDDSLSGGSGGDQMFGGDGNDRLFGNSGADTLQGNIGDDFIQGNAGDDGILGGQGNDTLHGGQGNDTLQGNLGDDFLSGDLGDDVMSGGAGADKFNFAVGFGADVVTDFNAAEGDVVQLPTGSSYSVSYTATDTVVDLGGGDTLTLENVHLTGSSWIVFA
jgi:Ca2+-binding RTX toxin-like protein